ncbi:lipase/acylhydrolase [Alicyclobacillus contaminans]|uniref:SGNH/GDSL hydrolase family protein n=1 Tax=Alicyclobacillus contaminans TaxID=392016 RepID=UPI00040B7C8A|nr:SGNH/GDSL hydrolase family protein [Alicyclobacillus contaminans]GMA51276.1 lipase/acylhydrolase [Alicyclobacillus contaminans]
MKIVCFGDSVTRGVSCANGRLRILRNHYPAQLQALLGERATVVNAGVFNDNSRKMAARMEADVLSHQPDCVVIGVGGNDCDFRWAEVAERPDADHEPVVPLAEYLKHLTNMLTTLRTRGIVPLLLNLIPLQPVRYYHTISEKHGTAIAHWIARCGGIHYWHSQYNRALQELAEALEVRWVNVRSAFKRSGPLDELLSDDGIHPTEIGYTVLSRAVHAALQQLSQAPGALSRAH